MRKRLFLFVFVVSVFLSFSMAEIARADENDYTRSFLCALEWVMSYGSEVKPDKFTWVDPKGRGWISFQYEGTGLTIGITKGRENREFVWYYEGNQYVGYNKLAVVNGTQTTQRPVHITSSEAEYLAKKYLGIMAINCGQ